MKKNALVIHSLFLLPLLTSSLSLSMQKQKQSLSSVQKQQIKKQTQRGKNKKPQPQPKSNIQPQVQPKLSYRDVVKKNLEKTNNNQPSADAITEEAEIEQFITQKEKALLIQVANTKEKVLEELKSKYHPIYIDPVAATILKEYSEDTDESINSIENYFAMSSSSSSSESKEATCQKLLQSVVLPTEEKGLGFLGNFEYYTKDPSEAIIDHLRNKTFDTTNNKYYSWLKIALKKSIANHDFASLALITTLCCEDYIDSIRYPQEEAEAYLNLCAESITDAEKDTEDIYINIAQKYNAKTIAFAQFLQNAKKNYEQEIQDLNAIYETVKNENENLILLRKQQLLNLSKLNKSMRQEAIDLARKPSNIRLHNECAEKITVAKVSLNLLDKISNKMPLIKEPKLALLQNQIENK